jgi:hypothetical protein
MGIQKSKQSTAKPWRGDNESSGSSDDSESDDTGPNNRVAKEPRKDSTVTKMLPKGSASESSQTEDGDCSSDSDSDDAKPRKTVAQVPAKGSTLKRPRCDDGGDSTENARPTKRVTKEPAKYIFHKSYSESNGSCTLLAGKTYFKVFRSFDISQSQSTGNSSV